jgi:hypothetical protein
MAGVTQQMGVTGNPFLRRNQTAELQARKDMFPSLLELEMQSEFNERQIEQGERGLALQEESLLNQKAQAERSFSMEQKRHELAERESDIGTGLQAAKLGVTALTTDFDFGGLFGGERDTTGTGFSSGGVIDIGEGKLQQTVPNATPYIFDSEGGAPEGFFSNIPIKSGIAGGAMGFGAGKLVGGKNKLLQAGAGILAGGVTGFLSGGLKGSLLGGLAGGGGGLISGLF